MTNNNEERWTELVQQYKDGTISDHDRFLLEKEALDDPFLFDTLEGYALHYNTEGKSENKTSIFNIRTMAAAASLVGLIALVFFMRNNSGTELADAGGEYAMVMDDESTEKDSKDEVTTSTSATGTIATSKTTAQGSKVNKENGQTQGTQNVNQESKENTNPQQNKPAPQNDGTDKELKDRIDSYTNSKPKITNASRVVVKDKEMASTAEEIQEKKSTTPTVDIETPEMASEDIEEESEAMMLDADDTVASKAKKKALASAVLIPMIGKSTFDDFVAERIEARGLRKATPITVIIEFSINENGRISDFKSLTPEYPECSAFAISLLQESGEWKTMPPAFEGRGTYEIVF